MAGEIFISYRRADAAWARLLHVQLRAEGVEAWYDAHVGLGEDWRIATAKALEDSRIFVLLFSANAAQSGDIAKELAAATLEKKLIIPVRLENIAPKGAFLYELASRNWVNAFDDTEAKLAELAKGLAHLVKTGARDESLLPFEQVRAAGRSRKPALIAAAALAVMAASTLAAWLFWPAKHWTVDSSRPFISTLALEDEPAFSPDGKMLAYSSGTALARQIYLRNMAGGDSIKISADGYDDTAPSWSSDGSHLAYLALKTGEPCRIMVATAPAGGAREVGRCNRRATSSIAWQPRTSFIYFIDRTDDVSDGIYRLNLDTGVHEAIVSRRLGDFADLRCSPDGRALLYLAADGFRTARVIVRDLSSGQEKTVTRMLETPTAVWDNSATWSEDSKSILLSIANGGGSEIAAYPLDGGKAYKVYSTATPVGHLTAGLGGHLAIETNVSRKNLARASTAPAQQPDIIDIASGITFSPSFAQDGTLVFLSNRSGTNAVWLQKPGKPPFVLSDTWADAPFRTAISPDGRHIAVATYSLDHDVSVHVLTAEGASVMTFDAPSVGSGLPTWTPDSTALIIFDPRAQRAMRVALDNPAHRTPAAATLWLGVTIRTDGTFATRPNRPGVWRIDAGEKLISAKYPQDFGPPLAFRGGDLLIPDFSAEDGARILAQPLAGGPDRVLAYAPGAEDRDYKSKMVVNPTNGEIIYVASVARDTNIDLLTLARR